METKDGFLVINKDKGCTSHDCVKQIRKLLNTKKVGHTGTLDPEVTGTLPIAIGSATRFIQYLPQGKTYIGQIQLGIRTNTDDIHGEIINQKSWPKISDEKLDHFLNRFRGIIKQIPPKVSSVHVNGERAYKKSFRNEVFELAPREVKIVKKVFKKEIITPGIRFSSNTNDQKRTLTPKQAFKNGSDWLVIGRPITKGNIKKNIQTLIKHLN